MRPMSSVDKSSRNRIDGEDAIAIPTHGRVLRIAWPIALANVAVPLLGLARKPDGWILQRVEA